MAEMLAMCGLDCAVCPALLAHENDDQELRVRTAADWSKRYGVEFEAAQINCVGCLNLKGVHVGHCGECKIRKCGLERGVKNCAQCDSYPCNTISSFTESVPPAKANLEALRPQRG